MLRKADDVGSWIALCPRSRQVVAYVVGERSEASCRRLRQAIPKGYRAALCYSDFWAAYAAVIPLAQHSAVGKESSETAHVERHNNTLRQRLGRLVRKSLSFSKATEMLIACFALFFYRYNQEHAIILPM